ncbi:MAG: hypothetical protein ACLPKB_01795 [Xanthobacteraceae bacterium]
MSSLTRYMLVAAAILLPLGQRAGAEPAPLAELLAVEATKDGLTLTVPTGGCTKKSDFELTSSPAKNGAAVVEVRRPIPDTCKGNFPDGLKLAYSWAELKLPKHTKISVKNAVESARPLPQREARRVSPHKGPRYCHIADRRSHLCTSRHRANAAHHYAHHRIHHHRGSAWVVVHAKRHTRRHHGRDGGYRY